jgi:hypothetical protein
VGSSEPIEASPAHLLAASLSSSAITQARPLCSSCQPVLSNHVGQIDCATSLQLQRRLNSTQTAPHSLLCSLQQHTISMQALSCRQAAFNGAGSATRRQQLQQRGAGLVARADPGFCRDKISERTDRMDEIAGTSTVIFLGADNTEVAVEVPKVRGGASREQAPSVQPPRHLMTGRYPAASWSA